MLVTQKQTDPNISDFEGDTPLIAAVTASCEEAARQLVAAGAHADQANEKGETPLIRSVQMGRSKLLALLLQSGADPHRVSPNGESPMDIARNKNDQAAIALLHRFDAAK